jgi:hypothetical protein
MVDTKTKTKAAMLNELESIKGLLLEEDDIPILQEIDATETHTTEAQLDASFTPDQNTHTETRLSEQSTTRIIVEEQQDFFGSPTSSNKAHPIESASELLDTINELEKHTAEVTAHKLTNDLHRNSVRPNLAKATGENPFLPAHIRSRLHGNNPPPLFAQVTARKIASSSVPSRLLGNTFSVANAAKQPANPQDIIDSIIEKLMPDIEIELRARLELMSRHLLDELNK